MKNKIFLIQILVVLLLSACVTPKDTNFLQDIHFPTTENAMPVDYKIIPGDQLMLRVYTLDENMQTLFSMYISESGATLSGSTLTTTTNIAGGVVTGGIGGTPNLPASALNVASDGSINIPYIGQLNVKDLTILEAKKVIGDKFSSFSPNVTVDISLRNRYFFVLGAAGSRSIPMSNLRMTIFQALALSGPIDVFGDRKNVKILRQTSVGTEFKILDLRSKDIVNSEYYYIQPNDVIYVQEVQRKFFGAVTSFTSIFGLITGLVGIVFLIKNLVD